MLQSGNVWLNTIATTQVPNVIRTWETFMISSNSTTTFKVFRKSFTLTPNPLAFPYLKFLRTKCQKYVATVKEPRELLANEEASSFIDFRYQAGLKTPVIRRLKLPRFKSERVRKSENFACSWKFFQFFEDFEWNT